MKQRSAAEWAGVAVQAIVLWAAIMLLLIVVGVIEADNVVSFRYTDF